MRKVLTSPFAMGGRVTEHGEAGIGWLVDARSVVRKEESGEGFSALLGGPRRQMGRDWDQRWLHVARGAVVKKDIISQGLKTWLPFLPLPLGSAL